jgi:hypothetical protein
MLSVLSKLIEGCFSTFLSTYSILFTYSAIFLKATDQSLSPDFDTLKLEYLEICSSLLLLKLLMTLSSTKTKNTGNDEQRYSPIII